jgi:hypothetical protein
MKKLFAFLLFAGILSFIPSSLHPLFSSSLSAQIPSNGLVAWYPFNGNANDESGNGNNGVVNGATLTTDRFGNANGAYSFNGVNSFIQTSLMGKVGQGSRAYSFWIRTTDSNVQTPLDYFGGSGSAFQPILNNPCIGLGVDGATGVIAKGNFSLVDGNWHHCLINFDSLVGNNINSVSIYMDGVLFPNTTCSALNPNVLVNTTNVVPMVIGKTVSNVRYVNGDIDDIAVFHRALTDIEIQQLFQSNGFALSPQWTTIVNQSNGLDESFCLNDGSFMNPISQKLDLSQDGSEIAFVGQSNADISVGALNTVNGDIILSHKYSNAGNDLGEAVQFDNSGKIHYMGCLNYPTTQTRPFVGLIQPTGQVDFENLIPITEIQADPSTMEVNKVNGRTYIHTMNWTGGVNLSKMLVIDAQGVVLNTNIINDYDYYEGWEGRMTKDQNGNIIFNGKHEYSGVYYEIVLRKTDADGNTLWTTHFNHHTSQLAHVIKTDSNGDVYMSYSGQGGFNISGIAKFDGVTGAELWRTIIHPTNSSWANLIITGQNNVVVDFLGEIRCYSGAAGSLLWTNPGINYPQAYTYPFEIDEVNNLYSIRGDSLLVLNSSGQSIGRYKISVGSNSVDLRYMKYDLTSSSLYVAGNIFDGALHKMFVSKLGRSLASGPSISACLPAYVPTNGLVGYWPFCGNANDESGNGNDGVVNGATLTADRFGNANGAYSFDGSSSKIVVSNSSSNSIGLNDYSLSAWINTSSISGTNGRIISKGSSQCVTGYMMRTGSPNSSKVFTENAYSGNCYAAFGSSGNINNGYWHMVTVAVTRSNGVKIFIDGVLDSQYSVNSQFDLSNNQDLFFGYNNLDNAYEPFLGSLDDIAIWNRALSDQEVLILYADSQMPCTSVSNTITSSIIQGKSYSLGTQTLTTAGTYTEVFTSSAGCDSTVTLTLNVTSACLPAYVPTNGLVGYWPFCGNANDESGNGNDGVVNGATLTADRFGNAFGAYSFDGINDFIGVSNDFQVNSYEFSLSAWFNINTPFGIGGSGYHYILDSRPNGVWLNVGQDHFQTSVGDGSADISLNAWHNISCTIDQFGNHVYIDGMEIANSPNFGIQLENMNTLNIGRRFSDSEYLFGSIDDVAIYNRALTPQEIQALYLSGQAPCSPATNVIAATIVQGQSYTLGTQTLTTAGTYTEVFTSAAGCDSTVTLTLAVEPLLTCNITAATTTLCAGESVNLSISTTGGAGTSSQLPANLQQGLVAYYPFNGNANDESGNGNNGTVNGAQTSSDRFGNSNLAYSFDGLNSGIDFSNIFQFHLNGDASISFWVKPEISQNYQGSILFSSPGSLDFNRYNFYLRTIQNTTFAIDYKEPFTNTHYFVETIPFATGAWSNVVLSRFNNTYNLFVNGVLQSSGDDISPNLPNSIGWTLGNDNASGSDFIGSLDDIVIFNRALSPSEIQQLYTSQSYAWSTGATTNSITVSPTTTTTYSCTVTSGLQTCTTSVDIVVNTPVAVTAQIEQVLAVDQPNFALNMTTNVGFNNTALAISPVVANNNSSTAALLNNTNASSGYANASGGNNMAISAATGAFNANTSSYFQWNVQVGNVQSAVLNNLSFGYRSSTSNAGPTQYCIRSSADNYASNIAQGSISNTSAWLLQNVALTLNLTSNATTTMRLYVFGGTGTSGNVNFRMDDLSWNFTTTSASCSDQGIQFLSNVSNAIDNPTYSWLVNGNPVSSDANFSSTALVQNDQVQLEITPTTGCYVNGPTASNVVSVVVNSIVTPTVVVSNNVSAINTQQLYNMTTGAASTNTVTNGTVGVSYSGFASSASNASTGYVGASGGNNMVASIPSGAINTGQYVAINVAANAGYGLTLKGMSWGYRSSATNGGPKFYAIRSSVDNYAQDLATGNLVNNSLWQNISLSDLTLAMVQNGAPVSFRVYFYGGTTLQGAANFRIDDWSLNLQEQAIPCNTQPIQFSASVTNGGNAPHYNWQLNGASVGTDLSTFTASNYQNGDVVSVVVQTNAACQTTSSVTASGSTIIAVNGQSYFQDTDNDGYGNNAVVVAACVQPAGYVTNNTDCNDASSTVSPSAAEICWNQIDDNCDGQVDENCFIYGCMNAGACNYNPAATADDGSCVLPQNEICNGLDDNCNGQIDEGLTLTSVTATPVSTSIFPTCSGNGIKPANLNVGTNSSIIEGNGLDLWYSLTAQYNTLRAGLSAAFGDNEIRLYQYNNGCFQLIATEHEVYATTTQGTGNQVLISDELIPGQTYYIAVHNISGAMNSSAKICFNHFVESTCDHYYSNNTGIYPNVCTSFKAQYKGNASNYIFNILSGTQNGQNMNITPWSYATGSALSVVSRIGSVFPVNMTASARTYTLNVPVVYSIPDAAGNYTSITANGTSTCTVTMIPETTIALRSIDRCPNIKTTTSSVAIDRTICGALRYEWEFTQQLPMIQPAVTVLGGLNSSVLFLNNVPGMGLSKTYNVRVRPIHANGEVGAWGSVQCMKTGTSGMILQSENESAFTASPIHRSTDTPIHYTIYPNPTITGHFTITSNFTSEDEVKQIAIIDITGKIVYKNQVVMNGNAVEIDFGQLSSGVYVVMVGEERLRLVVDGE